MINLSEDLINSSAPNSSAIQNAKSLIKKGKFVKLFKSPDETLIFGECEGSGKDNYAVSVDFVKPESPVYRCTCPSRQFPCKHALGLMYSYIEGRKFIVSDIPQEIFDKREKAEKREARKEETTEEKGARKVNKSALAKKIKAQIEGLGLLEKIVNNIIRGGFASLDPKALKSLDDQAKQLGDFYLPGVQALVRTFIYIFRNTDRKEYRYSDALSILSTLSSISKRGREYLEKRLQDEDLSMDAESTIEEWFGHAWQLSELKEYGRVQENAELIQLYFNSYIYHGKQEFLDLGRWINLKDGNIYETLNYRPFKAAKYIKEDDSFFSVVMTKELYIYPGDMNKRARWDEMTVRDVTSKDLAAIKSFAKTSYPDVIKAVKNQIKNPLSDKYPTVLLSYSRVGTVNDAYVLEDISGSRIELRDNRAELPSCHMLTLLKHEDLHNQAVLVRFCSDLSTGMLSAQPLAIVTDTQIIRLAF